MTPATRQTDLPVQPGLFDGAAPPAATPDRMLALARPRLDALLAAARAATRMPWGAQEAEVNAIIFHNMANWLPDAEREPTRAAFRAELTRLHAAE